MRRGEFGFSRRRWAISFKVEMVKAPPRAVWRRALALIALWTSWSSVAITSMGMRHNTFAAVCEVVKDAIIEHKTAHFPGHVIAWRVVRVLHWAMKQRLHSPRVYLRQRDVEGAGFWQRLQGAGAERSDGAFMSFLGVSVALFDELADRFGVASSGRGGQPARFSFADELALALRYVQTTGTFSDLEPEFGAAHAVVQRAMWPALDRLRMLLFDTFDAQCRYPTVQEGLDMEIAARLHYGVPPTGADFTYPCCLLMDGTITRVCSVSNVEAQQLYAYRGGFHALNNALVWDLMGCCVAYVICAPGTAHDARLGAPLIEQQQDVTRNPGRFGMLLDAGYTGVAKATPPSIFRPLKTEFIPADKKELFEAFSAYMTVRRQAVEWANGALKRLAPRILVPMRLNQLAKYRGIFEIALHLNNFRTRRIGFNQLKTVFFRHIDANFRQQLAAAQAVGGSAGLSLYFELVGEAERAKLERPLVA